MFIKSYLLIFIIVVVIIIIGQENTRWQMFSDS